MTIGRINPNHQWYRSGIYKHTYEQIYIYIAIIHWTPMDPYMYIYIYRCVYTCYKLYILYMYILYMCIYMCILIKYILKYLANRSANIRGNGQAGGAGKILLTNSNR